jgi:antitoxin VapB
MPKVAKLFTNGRSQAVRLPAEFRFEGKDVYVERVEGGVLLRPKPQTVGDWLADLYAKSKPFPSDFMLDRDQGSVLQDRDWYQDENA